MTILKLLNNHEFERNIYIKFIEAMTGSHFKVIAISEVIETSFIFTTKAFMMNTHLIYSSSVDNCFEFAEF